MDNVLLSICIPTYNGGNTIGETVNCALKAVHNYSDIEVIVSDNGSEDNTVEILDGFKDNNKLKVYKNSENIGFNRNLLLLIEKYSKGKYCWMIGDDDFITPDAIDLLYDLLSSGKADYIAVGFQTRYIQNYKKKIIKHTDLRCKNMSFFEIMNEKASLDNLLGTFMSVHIFNRNMVRNHVSEDIMGSGFNHFANIFPNSYLMTNTFYNNERCYKVENKLIEAIFRETKSYSNKWDTFVSDIFPSYYNYCLSLSVDKNVLKKNKQIIDDFSLQIEINNLTKGYFKEVNFGRILSFKLLGSIYRFLKHQYEKKLR